MSSPRRLSDSMIRSNVFGTVVGAVVNPQEATARIVDSMLRLQDGEYPARNGSSYDDAVRLAEVDEGEPGYQESLEGLRRYALEALRLQPQGEVLLRLCVQDNAELGGVLHPQGHAGIRRLRRRDARPARRRRSRSPSTSAGTSGSRAVPGRRDARPRGAAEPDRTCSTATGGTSASAGTPRRSPCASRCGRCCASARGSG